MKEKEYIYKEDIRKALYDADAITMRAGAIISAFPAADVVEVKRGRWIEETNTWANGLRCSECGHKIFGGTTNFCPNCGAKMEES